MIRIQIIKGRLKPGKRFSDDLSIFFFDEPEGLTFFLGVFLFGGGKAHGDEFDHQFFFRPEEVFHFFQRIDFAYHHGQAGMDDGGDFAVAGFVRHGGFEVGLVGGEVVAELFLNAGADFKLLNHVFFPFCVCSARYGGY